MTSQGRCGETDLQHLSSVPFADPRTLISPRSTSGLCVGSGFTFLLCCPTPPVSPNPRPHPVALIFTPLSRQRVGSHPRLGAHPAQSPSLLPSPHPRALTLWGGCPRCSVASKGQGRAEAKGGPQCAMGSAFTRRHGECGHRRSRSHDRWVPCGAEGLPGLMRALGVECQGSLATPYPSRGSL